MRTQKHIYVIAFTGIDNKITHVEYSTSTSFLTFVNDTMRHGIFIDQNLDQYPQYKAMEVLFIPAHNIVMIGKVKDK